MQGPLQEASIYIVKLLSQIIKMEINKLAYIINPTILELIILPTEKCNFRCIYCYEDFEIGKMNASVMMGVKNLLKQRCSELKKLNLSWFGGEPLLAKDIILDISSFAMECMKSNPSLNYSGIMTTNAYLLNQKTFRELVSLRVVDYQITLDGSKKSHNRTRVKANGVGTFDVIWNNLKDIKKTKYDFRIKLRVHYHRGNLDDIELLLYDLKKEFGGDSRFNCLPHTIEKLGGVNDDKFVSLDEEQNKNVLSKFKSILNNELVIEEQKLVDHVCYASKPNSLLIRSDGRIGKCTVALNDEINTIGRINEDGSLTIDQHLAQIWMRGIFTDDNEILACPLHNLPGTVNITMDKIAKSTVGSI